MSSTCPSPHRVVLLWRSSEPSWTKEVSMGAWMDLNTVCVNGSVWITRWRWCDSLSHMQISIELFNIQMNTGLKINSHDIHSHRQCGKWSHHYLRNRKKYRTMAPPLTYTFNRWFHYSGSLCVFIGIFHIDSCKPCFSCS